MGVVVVFTPGVAPDGYLPLLDALRADGHAPAVVSLPCSGDAQALSAAVARGLRDQPQPPVVVAHGLGATLALLAADRAEVAGWVLLAPVFDAPTSAAARFVGSLPVGASVDLAAPLRWGGHDDVRRVLLGADLPSLGCFPAGLARDLASWSGPDAPALPWEAVRGPVWVGVGLLDELAPTELVVPGARQLRAEVGRLGLGELADHDLDHAAMLGDPVAVSAAVRAVARSAP